MSSPQRISFWLTIALASLAGQTPTFEAASIKPQKEPTGPTHFTVLPNRLDVKNLSLGYLIEQAYDIPDYLLSGPGPILNHRFDVLATSGASAPRGDMMVMLQNLLRERFHLETHWETRSESAYRLVALPGGPKMKTVPEGYSMPNSPLRDGNSMHFNGPMSMRQLAESLTRSLHKPVLDFTSLEGYFTIALTFAPDDLDATKDTGPPLPTLPKAVEEQLGLKLISGKEPIKFLIVDHAEAVPTEN